MLSFLQYLGLNSGYTESHSTTPFFCDGFFGDRVWRTICLGWLQTAVLLISTSYVARITGVSHQCSAGYSFC
jgi:hypothetical protein